LEESKQRHLRFGFALASSISSGSKRKGSLFAMASTFSELVNSLRRSPCSNLEPYILVARPFARLERGIALGSAQALKNEVDLIYGSIQVLANSTAENNLSSWG
jgi:hypothetical protein